MQPFDASAAYYDLLYDDREYEREAESLAGLLRRYAPATRSLLEFGSGTGRHARLLAAMGFAVTGVERSPRMLARAVPGDYVQADIRTVALDRQFDAVFSLFHVMSYQTSNDDVLAVLGRAGEHLRPGGLFVFDFWYTPAVLTQGAGTRVKRVGNDAIEVLRVAEPVLMPNLNRVDVNYRFRATDRATGRVSRAAECHPMRHFSLPELDLFARATGFVRRAAVELTTGNEPSTATWGPCVVLAKAKR
jgi:SAM-dependent methyltransferase